MAERTEILSIKLDAEGALKSLEDIGSQLLRVKENKKALEDAYKSGTKTEAEYVRGMAELKAQTQSLNSQQSAYQRVLTANQTLLKGNTGSIEENRARLSGLTAQYIKLSEAERNNTDVGVKMQKEIKKLSDDLKEQEAAIGNTSRNVGNYKGAIMDAIGGMGGFGKAIETIGTGLKANPIGLLVTALTLLPQLFNSSAEGADAFAKVMSIINAVVQEGLKRLVGLGSAAVKLMTGDFKGAMVEGKAAVTGFSDSVTKAVKEGGELADRMDALENAESRFAVTSAATRKEIDALLIQAKNRQTSEKERMKLYEEAERLEVQNNQQALKLANERLKLIQKENAQKTSDRDEEIKKENEQKAKIIELETESQNILEKIQNRKDALADAAEAKRVAREKKAREDYEKHKKEAQDLLDDFQKLIQGIADGRKAQLDAEKAKKDEFLKGIDAQFQQSEKIRQKEIKAKQDEDAELDKLHKKELKRKQDEFDAANLFADAANNLASLMADKNAELAGFQKALALFKIAIATAAAIAKGVEDSQDVGFPANLVAMATTIAAITANMLQVKQLMTAEPPKAPKMADGGILEGRSHAAGGIRGTGSFAGIEVEGGEAIINKRSTAKFRTLLNAINLAGGGRNLLPSRYNAEGGLLPDVTRSAIGNLNSSIDYHRLAQVITNLPSPVVVVKDISAGLKAVQVKESRINS